MIAKGVSLQDVIDSLPSERRAAVEIHGQELVEQENQRQALRKLKVRADTTQGGLLKSKKARKTPTAA